MVINMKKKNKEAYCNLDYFMKHGCTGCKLGRRCDEYENRVKRDRDNRNSSDTTVFDNKKLKELNKDEIQDKW